MTYSNKRLSSCTKDDMSKGLVGSNLTTLLTFKEFQEESKKTKALSPREVFSRMLIRMHGVTWNMALAITERYPTLPSLIQAYDK